MSTVIRLRREGTRNAPFYRVVVADKRSPRDGKFLELVGNYDPVKKSPDAFSVKMDRIEHWVSKGAKPTETVQSLMKKAAKKAKAAAVAV